MVNSKANFNQFKPLYSIKRFGKTKQEEPKQNVSLVYLSVLNRQKTEVVCCLDKICLTTKGRKVTGNIAL